MPKFSQHRAFFPLLLLALCLLVFGLFIPFLGFYWDDLPYLWFRHTAGVSGVVRAVGMDRPLLGAVYSLPMSLLGESPWVWQLAAILARWGFCVSTWLFFGALWPEKENENKLITLLLMVIPGFKQQWISVIYTHVFLVFALYFLSLTLFVRCLRKGKYFSFSAAGAMLLSLYAMTAVEYVAGFELLRPFIIFKIVSESSLTNSKPIKARLARSLRIWLPYALGFLLFLVYRVFLASSVLYKFQQTESLSVSPWITIWQALTQQFRNLATSTYSAWGQIFHPILDLDIKPLFSKVYLVFSVCSGLAAFLFTGIFLPAPKPDKSWELQLATGAIIALLTAGLPFWAANLNPGLEFPSDRVLLPYMLASSALLFLFLAFVGRNIFVFRLLFSLVFGLSAGFQLFQANQFRTDWDYFRQFFQQMTWRIPSLTENTLLVTNQLPLAFYSDNSLSAAFNWLYAPESPNLADKDLFMPYLINYTESRLGFSLPSLDSGQKIRHPYRIYTFNGSTDQMLLFYHQPPGCLHIVDEGLDDLNPLLLSSLREYAPNSRSDLIIDEIRQNEVPFLNTGAERTWCYFYQKASLAADLKDWETVVALASEAFALNDHPNDASERFPFIEAFAHTGNWESALHLSRTTIQISALYQPMLCRMWEMLAEETPASEAKTGAMLSMLNELQCTGWQVE